MAAETITSARWRNRAREVEGISAKVQRMMFAEGIRVKWDRKNLEMVVALSWRKNEEGVEAGGERLTKEVVTMDKDPKERLEMEEHITMLKRMYITCEDLQKFAFAARCPGCMSMVTAGRKRSREAPPSRHQTDVQNNINIEGRKRRKANEIES